MLLAEKILDLVALLSNGGFLDQKGFLKVSLVGRIL